MALPNPRYLSEQLGLAAYYVATGPGSLQQRLQTAWTTYLLPLDAGRFPANLQPHAAAVRRQLVLGASRLTDDDALALAYAVCELDLRVYERGRPRDLLKSPRSPSR